MSSDYLVLPHFDPAIFEFGPIGLRWYGLMYLLGFIFARWLGVRRAKQPNSGWTVDQVDSLLFNSFMGIFFGGRIFIPCLGRGHVFPWRFNRCDYRHDYHL